MAGVKTTRGGPKKETQFASTDCSVCGVKIVKLMEAHRVKALMFDGPKHLTVWQWTHRACLPNAATGSKK
jgi:hypothetical protein